MCTYLVRCIVQSAEIISLASTLFTDDSISKATKAEVEAQRELSTRACVCHGRGESLAAGGMVTWRSSGRKNYSQATVSCIYSLNKKETRENLSGSRSSHFSLFVYFRLRAFVERRRRNSI
jgi:hypothetical protein